MTRVDLEAAELMLDEATPGPWHANRHGEVCFTLPSGLSFAIADVYGDAGPDRDLIVAAPTLIRALIEEVRGLREAMPTDEERIAIGNRLRHDYDRRYPGDALVDHVKAIDWLARIEAARSR
mgnify:CR=1 FL=1